jgi:sugar phosphate permease
MAVPALSNQLPWYEAPSTGAGGETLTALDRTNIGNAKIEGLQEDLNMTNQEYNNTLTIFFISYSLAEPLTQILLKRFRPSVFLPVTMILWGICMTTMGLVHDYGGLLTVRWFLGLTEAGLFPGVNYVCVSTDSVFFS